MSQRQPDSDIVNCFGHLAVDAAPQSPRVTIEDVVDDEEDSQRFESNTINDIGASRLIGHNVQNGNVSTSPKRKSKFKKPFFNIWNSKNKEKFNISDSKAKKQPDSSPIATQANGNVINIINSHDIHWGPEITYNIGSNGNDETPLSSNFKVKRTKSISAIMHSKDEVTHDYLNIVSKNIGSHWKNVCRSLSGMTEGRIELLCENYKLEGISEVIYQILLDWVRNEDGNLGQLTTHLWEEGKDKLVQQMAAFYKVQQLEKEDDSNTKKH